MSSNTNIGNTPVNQGYVQLIHTGETGGIDGTLRTLYDGDGTASDLQIASNKVKISTELYIGSKTITEYIQDTVGAMLVTNASHTNLSAAYDDAGDGAIDLTASGEVTLTGTQTLTNKTLASPTFTGTANGVNLTLSGDLTVNGTTTTVNQTNLDVSDNIIGLNRGASSNANDSGLIIERGITGDNVFIGWDESADRVVFGVTSGTPDSTGNLTIINQPIQAARLYGDVTGNVSGSASLNLLISSNLSDLANVATARTNLGLGTIATQASDSVSITGGSIAGITDLSIADGGTGASNAGNARINLGLGTLAELNSIQVANFLASAIQLSSESFADNDTTVMTSAAINDRIESFGYAPSSRQITTGATSGLNGGGDLSANRSLSLNVNNLAGQVPALELADKIAIYDNSATETNVATLTQLKAIVNTDTNTNQLTTFNVSGDSGTNQTISHNNTLTISGGNGISTSTSATDILSVALGGFSSLTLQSSPDAQDLIAVEEAIGGAIKKVKFGTFSSGISFNGSTANGLLTYGNSTTADVESNLTFDGNHLDITSGHLVLPYGEINDAGTDLNIVGTNAVTLQSSAGTALTIPNASTNVGIGETSPEAKLHIKNASAGTFTASNSQLLVENNTTVRLTLLSPAANGCKIEFGDINDQDVGMINYDHSNNYMAFTTNASEKMRIDSSGNVGIGTISPSSKLHVSGGDSRHSGGKLIYEAGGVSDYFRIQRSSSSGRSQIQFATETTSELWRVGLTGGGGEDFVFWNGSNNVLILDRSANEVEVSGKLGVGTDTPDTTLDITSTGANGIVLNQQSSDSNTSSRLFFKQDDTTWNVYGSGGALMFSSGATVGSSSGTLKFQMKADGFRILDGALGVDVQPSTTDGRIDAGNDVVAYSTSDKRLKENIKPLDSALDKVMNISGVSFDWKALTEEEKKTIHGNEGHDVGVIAQEIEKVLPEVVTTRDSGYKAVKYEKIVPLLIEAIKEQQKQIEELKNG